MDWSSNLNHEMFSSLRSSGCVTQWFAKLQLGGLDSPSWSLPCQYVTKLELGNEMKLFVMVFVASSRDTRFGLSGLGFFRSVGILPVLQTGLNPA
jgi:hypothetical protein